MSEKIAVFAPMPSASESTAIRVNKGLRRKVRRANFRSARIPPMQANIPRVARVTQLFRPNGDVSRALR